MSRFRLIIGLFLILAGLSSCRPRKVLSQSKMADLLYDIHLTEALASGANGELAPTQWMRGMNPTDFRDMAYQSVLKKHNVSEKTFYASVDYYSKHLCLYSKIYKDVDKRLDIFIKDIDNGKYNVINVAQTLANIKIDTVSMRKWYFSSYDSVSASAIHVYLPVSTTLHYPKCDIRRWMRKVAIIPIPLNMEIQKPVLPKVDSIAKIDSISNKSLAGVRDASSKINNNIVKPQKRLKRNDAVK
jgi:hypothetical protein